MKSFLVVDDSRVIRNVARRILEALGFRIEEAADGQLALDGDGSNSPFATALLNRLPTPNLEISLLFRMVRDDVLTATGKRQEPFVYGSLPGESLFFLQR